MEELALQEQQLNNYLQNDELLKALKLALKLERPMQTLKIVREIIKKGDTCKFEKCYVYMYPKFLF